MGGLGVWPAQRQPGTPSVPRDEEASIKQPYAGASDVGQHGGRAGPLQRPHIRVCVNESEHEPGHG